MDLETPAAFGNQPHRLAPVLERIGRERGRDRTERIAVVHAGQYLLANPHRPQPLVAAAWLHARDELSQQLQLAAGPTGLAPRLHVPADADGQLTPVVQRFYRSVRPRPGQTAAG